MADGGDDAALLAAARALPLADRAAHAHWKARRDAYADLAGLAAAGGAVDGERRGACRQRRPGVETPCGAPAPIPIPLPAASLLVRGAGDANAAAQDAALDACVAWLQVATEESAAR
jgi:hypothetical protein